MAQSLCGSVFQIEAETPVKESRFLDLFNTEKNQQSKILEMIGPLSPQERLKLALKKLSRAKIEALTVNDEITIVPIKNGSEINHLAFKLQENYGTLMVYDPALKAIASYHPGTNTIYLSALMVMTGKPDLSFYHEVRHASLGYRALNGTPSWSEGEFIRSWSAGKLDGWFSSGGRQKRYSSYLSFQEVETWAQGVTYIIKGLRLQLAEKAKVQEVLEDVNYGIWTIDEALEVIESVQEKIATVIHDYEKGNGPLKLKAADQGWRQAEYSTAKGTYSFVLPQELVERTFWKSSEQKKTVGLYLRESVLDRIEKKASELYRQREVLVSMSEVLKPQVKAQKLGRTAKISQKTFQEIQDLLSDL